MKIYWKNAFYCTELHSSIPAAAVEITEEEWKMLLAEQSAGKRIVTNADGRPIAEKIPQPTLEKLKEEAYNTLWNNYKTYQQTYVDAEDLTLAVVCSSQGSLKGAAVQTWVMQLWARYYAVKDAITGALDAEALAVTDLTANAFAPPPYTIRELNEEARLKV